MKKLVLLTGICLFSFAFLACDETSTDLKSEVNTTYQETDFNTGDLSSMSEEEIVNEYIYPENEVLDVNITISESDYSDMLVNAMDETYHACNITYNGFTLENVAIRTKGNSSLKDVFQSGGDRFSWNIDLNYYEDQDLFGLDKLILNNLYMDPTMMAEFITYEALDSLDIVSSRTTFVALYLNSEYYGLYLSVEHVGNEFLDFYFGNSDGEFYKPDSGTGSDLNYISDSYNYSGLIDKNAEDQTDNTAIIELMEGLSTGENIDDLFNVESYLKYLAVSTFTVNLDSYQGGMNHNYYLYNNEGVFEWIAWDLNMSFNGFPMLNVADSTAVGFLIDEPTAGAIDQYPLIEAILSNETYVEMYHTYMQALLDGYFNAETFETRVDEIYYLIESYVENDPSSFYTYTTFNNAVYHTSGTTLSLLDFVNQRSENVQGQLDGTIASTNNGQGNELGQQGPGGMPPRR